MQKLPSETELNIMKFCDMEGLISFGLSCKLYYNHHQPLLAILQGLSHPDHLVQLTSLRRLLNDIEQQVEILRKYYLILIEQLCQYAALDKGSILKLHAYMIIAILAFKTKDFKTLAFAIAKLCDKCIHEIDLEALFHYLLCLVTKVSGVSDTLITFEQQIIEGLNTPHRLGFFQVRKGHLLLVKGALSINPMEEQDQLLEQICQWFQDDERNNRDMHRDMFLNLRYLMQKRTQEKIQQWVSEKLLQSLLPPSVEGEKKQEIPVLDCYQALDVFQLVGVDYFNELLNNRKLALESKQEFLNLLARCHHYEEMNKLIISHQYHFFPLKRDPWERIKSMEISKRTFSHMNLEIKKEIINYDIDNLLNFLKNDKDKLKLDQIIDLLKKTKTTLTEKIEENLYQLALIWIEDSYTGFEPWELKTLLSDDKYKIIEQKYTDGKVKRYNDDHLFRIILHAKQDTCRESAINAVEKYLSSRSVALSDLNALVHKYEAQLTSKMHESILSQYQQHLSQHAKNVGHEHCRSAYDILKRWGALQSFEKEIKSSILKHFNEIDLKKRFPEENSESVRLRKLNLIYGNVLDYFRLYSSLFPEDAQILYEEFFLKLKPIIHQFHLDDSDHESTKQELVTLLVRGGSDIASEIVNEIWLPLLESKAPKKINMVVYFARHCFQFISNELLATKLIPALMLQKELISTKLALLKMYHLLTPEQRELLCKTAYKEDSIYQSIYIELSKIYSHQEKQLKISFSG